MPTKRPEELEPFTIEVAAAELPKRILDRFPQQPPADARFAVTVEPAASEKDKLAALLGDLQAGLTTWRRAGRATGRKCLPG